MIVTPTNTGSAIAGASVGVFGWSIVLKGTEIPFIKGFYTRQRREQLFAWMNGNKSMALLALESLNYGLHGVTDANAVIFALGNTIVNVLGLWVYLPLRQNWARRTRVTAILQGVKVA
jgi:hypothetical protein